MSAVKERILGALMIMSEEQAQHLWTILEDEFANVNNTWDSIEETDPDETDLKMLNEIKNDPDCNVFIPADKVYDSIGI